MSTGPIQLNIPNKQLVYAVGERLLDALEGVPNIIALAALADMVALICEMEEEHTDALLQFVSERAWSNSHGVYVKRTPRPDNEVVIPLSPAQHGR
jgi:thymidylate synthase